MNSSPEFNSLDELKFDNRFVDQLPADRDLTNRRRQVMESAYSRVAPTKVKSPKLVHFSREVAELIGLDPEQSQIQQFADVFGGNTLLTGMAPFAMCYGGHQFGNWVKGAGPTPYSRTADGLAVLRSSVREFLCSEAMFYLGVPTTRALSLVTTGEEVMRDMFYDGNQAYEPGAVVCRVAPSFTRFGNFQIFAARGDTANLQRLVDFTIVNDFSHLGKPSPEVYANWFEEVCVRTCDTVLHWMRVGFVHGVMNTDNMSILGLTIDYGPYGWLEGYDPGWTPNTTDASGKRYRFGNQPLVAHWNLYQLNETQPLQRGLDTYLNRIESRGNHMVAQKLGLDEYRPDDETLKKDLFEILTLTETDMTIWYRNLADVPIDNDAGDDDLLKPLLGAYYYPAELAGETKTRTLKWLHQYRDRIRMTQIQDFDRRNAMNRINPKYVLRNYMAQLAIDKAEKGDGSLVVELLELLRRPYEEQPEYQKYFAKRPEWARHRAGCSMLSCSS